jgi:hypothetical protein
MLNNSTQVDPVTCAEPTGSLLAFTATGDTIHTGGEGSIVPIEASVARTIDSNWGIPAPGVDQQ